jgi:hypothetical protein
MRATYPVNLNLLDSIILNRHIRQRLQIIQLPHHVTLYRFVGPQHFVLKNPHCMWIPTSLGVRNQDLYPHKTGKIIADILLFRYL